MKLVYGTTNSGKLQHMKNMLQGLDIELVGLKEVALEPVNVYEQGNNPLENARQKALAYYSALKVPVFSCDSGLYIAGLNHYDQPGVHIRRVNGRELDDERMLEYYAELALRYGGQVKARHRNAICLVVDDQTLYEYDGDDLASEEFLIVPDPHPRRIPGFPLDSLSVDCNTGRYYFELEHEPSDDNSSISSIGFRRFFERTILSDIK